MVEYRYLADTEADMLWTWIGIAVVGGVIVLSQARKMAEFAFLLSLFLLFGGYGVLLASALFGMPFLWLWALLTVAGMIVGRLSAERDIPDVEWRARGFHAATLAAVAGAMALVTLFTTGAVASEPYRWAAAAYGVLAVWNGLAAAHMAWWVLTDKDGKSHWNYGDGYNPNDDYGQYD